MAGQDGSVTGPDFRSLRGRSVKLCMPGVRDQCRGVIAGFAARAARADRLAAPAADAAAAFLDRARTVRDLIERRCERWDLVPDLAEDIGSARWFRGLGTMVGLGVFALSFWPNLTQVEAATGLPSDPTMRDQFRSQMIMPLALGGDSGTRMAPGENVVPLAHAPERPRIALVATLAQGDSFGRMLQRAGVGPSEAAGVTDLVAGVMPLGGISPGTRVDITLGRRQGVGQPRSLEKLDFRARFDLELAVRRENGALMLTRRPIAVDDTPLRVTGTVGSSLYRSARAAGAPAEAIQQYLQALDSRLDSDAAIAPGDSFDMIVSYRRSAIGEKQVGGLLFAGLSRDGKSRVELLRWGGQGQFMEAAGTAARVQGMVSPVSGRLTSGYGMRRHPILGYLRMHAGIDFAAAWGTPIYAVSDGIVSYAGRHGGHGNYVRLDHGGGIATGYAHMSRIAVPAGYRVRAGQVIGHVGSTGLSTGPHLHYELYRNGKTVNPQSVRFTMTSGIDKNEQAAFKSRLAALKAVAPGKALQPVAIRKQVGSGGTGKP